jgi:hypothetical protein
MNPKIHPRTQTDALKGILGEVGWLTGVIVNRTSNRVLDGHDRIKAAMEAGQSTAPVFYVTVPEDQEPYILATFDPVGALAATDSAILDELLREVSSDDPAVQALLAHAAEDAGLYTGGDTDDGDDPLDALLAQPDTPETLFSSDNEWGIPTLDSRLLAGTVTPPVERWGRMARHGGVVMPGTWHFYTEDYKFRALLDDPAPVPNSGAVNAVEVNYSTYTAMPPALALYGIYRKRWLARWWQSRGVRILVDLNVEPQFEQLNLLGVPRGWKAYATRAYDQLLPDADHQWEIAAAHAGTEDILFMILGGGKAMQEHAGARGWVWIPQENHVVEGKVPAYGQG